jgi:hypothetical protein
MLQEETQLENYKVSFSLEEIKPLVLSEIDEAQNINSHNSLWNLKDYKYYHNKLIDYYKQIGKENKPSMADKLAYIILLSNPKRKLLESTLIEDYKLFREDRNPDFKIVKVIKAENNENDEHHEDHNDCICSYQNLQIVYFVENIITGIVLQVGSECIKKYKLVSKKEFEDNKKKFNEIITKKKENQLEIEQNLPLGYFKEQRQLDKKRKIETQLNKKRKIEEKIQTGNYKLCYLCNISLINIKSDKNKRTCNKCINNDRGSLIMSPYYRELIVNIKDDYKRYNCNNCDTEYISSLSKNEYLCKKCVKNNKIISCKICKKTVLLEICSNDIYCEDCEVRLINCIDCNEVTIRCPNNLARCETCQLCYDNKIILQNCCECEEDFGRKQNEIWRIYCGDCYKNIEFPKCKCLKKMVQRTVTKESVNKGRKFYVCRENKCKEFIWV